ncbi:CAP domain-containing protein [Atopobacter phocae]|uniref:CAP domain-containing protein n=1 Tax=Atopobacter phocae TaxID=136492 RepID=UPI00046ED77A|nr:CAP domain-containing protein [Atopobacter phocae]
MKQIGNLRFKKRMFIAAMVGTISLSLSNEQIIHANENWKATQPNQITIQEKNTEYTMKKGDTLWAIAMRTNINIQTLAAINNVRLSEGDQYHLPVGLTIKFGQEKITISSPNSDVLSTKITINNTNKVISNQPIGTDITQFVEEGDIIGQPNNLETIEQAVDNANEVAGNYLSDTVQNTEEESLHPTLFVSNENETDHSHSLEHDQDLSFNLSEANNQASLSQSDERANITENINRIVIPTNEIDNDELKKLQMEEKQENKNESDEEYKAVADDLENQSEEPIVSTSLDRVEQVSADAINNEDNAPIVLKIIAPVNDEPLSSYTSSSDPFAYSYRQTKKVSPNREFLRSGEYTGNKFNVLREYERLERIKYQIIQKETEDLKENELRVIQEGKEGLLRRRIREYTNGQKESLATTIIEKPQNYIIAKGIKRQNRIQVDEASYQPTRYQPITRDEPEMNRPVRIENNRLYENRWYRPSSSLGTSRYIYDPKMGYKEGGEYIRGGRIERFIINDATPLNEMKKLEAEERYRRAMDRNGKYTNYVIVRNNEEYMRYEVGVSPELIQAFNRHEIFDVNLFNEEMINLVNEERAKYRLKPLAFDSELLRISQIRSDELSKYGSIRVKRGNLVQAHVRLDGSSFRTAAYEVGYPQPNRLGENLASNYTNNNYGLVSEKYMAKVFFDQWKNSPSHYRNMMVEGYNNLAVGLSLNNYIDIYSRDGSSARYDANYITAAMILSSM